MAPGEPVLADSAHERLALECFEKDTAEVSSVSVIDGKYALRHHARRNLHLVGLNVYHPDAEWNTFCTTWARDKGDVGPIKVYIPLISFSKDIHDAASLKVMVDAATPDTDMA